MADTVGRLNGDMAMRVRFVVFMLVLWLPLAAGAESSVWRVTRGDGVLYLAGSIHVLRPSDHPLPAEFDAAYQSSEQLVLEMDPAVGQSAAAQQMILARGLYPANETIKDHLSPVVWRRLEEYCRTRRLPLGAVERFKPWLLTMTLALGDMAEQGFDPRAGVDMHYAALAGRQGKPIAGLETMEEQVNVLAAFDGAADPVVASFLDESENTARVMGEMVAAWRSGDAPRLDALVTRELRLKYPLLHAAVLSDRNRRWLAPLERWSASGKRVMVIVGSAHLVGDDGLIALLRARGYRVEPLSLEANGAAAPIVHP